MSSAREPLLKDFITSRKDLKDLESLGLVTIHDVFRNLPRRYIFPGQATRIRELEVGQEAVLYVRVTDADSWSKPNQRSRGPRMMHMTRLRLSDGEATISATFFNQKWMEKKAADAIDSFVLIAGKVEQFRGSPQLQNPKFITQDGSEEYAPGAITKPIPIYRANARIASNRIQRLTKVLLAAAPQECFADVVPQRIRTAHGLPDFRTVLQYLHDPAEADQPEQAIHALKFEEALSLQAELASRRRRFEEQSAIALAGAIGGHLDTFDAELDFTLTRSQIRVGTEISADLLRSRPMNRLLHGDVGSGKTLVALRAMLQAVDSGKQAALVAPTEVLAAQHYNSLRSLLGSRVNDGTLSGDPDGVRIELITGSLPAARRRKVALAVASGEVDIVVGTHALMSEKTVFAELGLVVVDEQHRFGVRQREALRTKGGEGVPHMLVMTATPIPRTVAMTVFGDLDVSVLDELPGGPKRIKTFVVGAEHPRWYERMYQVMAERIAAGQQVFTVVGRIDSKADETGLAPGGVLPGVEDTAAALAARPELCAIPTPGGGTRAARIGILHGRMTPEDKDAAMAAFVAGDTDVLVATTVIEVGVDVPNATCMAIMDAEMFGVAQLHQLRGRIGRDGREAICFFATHRPPDDPARERLDTVAGTLDGFALATFDVETRREGDVLGLSQSGLRTSLKYLSVIKDENLVLAARADAFALVDEDPTLESFPALRAHVDRQILDADETWMEVS
ncbi:ATP-dependent DNA helicase RecG [Brevibacterium sp. 50QC2O2]|jgi:ATP-dependent DNA helicase RecG|uniref:ATP-dependent DNA helicase RecG n=1 Tax=Brevibacterium TaxID=1696 RepID=UPI00211C8705|nr:MULTISPECIES: ATP-dependent DNA helicase RecG [unclassified Brevibacterium]MCQ9367799.1 ATP-dependent DNA helicase RecG [Brevibacterium sp. 91QC2O2]MCQ9384895.1 ATP-dependent DNA helicase RecG [Brevibacterium sp. 68QC2CO]MCQ9388058.1 ATP-dependent DNA helicase RecG [Brevibacterium sp. 50QC2O2]